MSIATRQKKSPAVDSLLLAAYDAFGIRRDFQ
jgi:hypothetical protein